MAIPIEGSPPYEPGPTPELTVGDLAAPVHRALDDPGARIMSWTVESAEYKRWNRSSGGVHFVAGSAFLGDVERSWKIVLKVLEHRTWDPPPAELARQCDDGGDGPSDWSNWRREALMIESGLLDDLPDCFGTPKALGIVAKGIDRLWIWYEHASGTLGTGWSQRELLESAEHLGVFHARHMNCPRHDWFCRPFIRQAAFTHRLTLVDDLRRASLDPLLRRVFTPEFAVNAESLRDSYGRLTMRLSELPSTLCHRDLNPGNLLKSDGGTVVFDWGQVGAGPAGEDLASLVLSWAFARSDEIDVREVGELALERYLHGLRTAGWSGDRADVEAAYHIIAACHYGLSVLRLAGRWIREPEERLMMDDRLLQVERAAGLLDRVQPFLR